jgi:hypothetical protein
MSIDCSIRVKVPIWNFGNFRLLKKQKISRNKALIKKSELSIVQFEYKIRKKLKLPDRKKKPSRVIRADRCPIKLQYEKNHKIDFFENACNIS